MAVIPAEHRWYLLEEGRPEDQEGDGVLEVCLDQVYYAAGKCLECLVDQWADFSVSGAFYFARWQPICTSIRFS
jgi:hypothetical protein